MSRPAGSFDAARYFRGDHRLKFYNVGTKRMRELARGVYDANKSHWTVADAMRLADGLMRDPYLETKSVGIELVARYRRSFTPALLAWIGGALVTAKILVNPFYAAKFPYTIAERGFARRLPVELTMANDLPIMLDTPRTHIWFSEVMLYFLDQHAYVPEVVDAATGERGIWVAGDGRADIIVRSEWPIEKLTITAESPIKTTFIVSMGSAASQIPLTAGKRVTFDVPASGVRALKSYSYLLSARSTEGFTPRLQDPSSNDPRNLGVLMMFTAVPR